MILHPGVIALLVGAFFVCTMLIYATLQGITIIRQWDLSSSDESQLLLERKTYLLSTIMNYVLGFEVFCLFLFIYTLDDIHRVFIGAMCATGSLNANPIGWYALFFKICTFFLAALWIAMNYIDQKGEDYPLIKKKYKFLLFITPIVFIESILLVKYFNGLDPQIIASCCGSLFSEDSNAVASALSGMPIKGSMIAFYTTGIIFILTGLASLFFKQGLFKYLYGIISILFFIVSLTSVISFISIYYYELPTHQCPFDILQKHYNAIGYPLYVSLFGGVTFALFTLMGQKYKARQKNLRNEIERIQSKWTIYSLILTVAFIGISTYPVLFSSFNPF